MSDADHHKPVPAREAAESARSKPTPVRELGVEPPSLPEADVPETSLDAEDGSWVVRVLGRSGGTAGTAAPLLLLGFWPEGEEGRHTREALVVGASLASLSPASLRLALSRAEEPRDPDRSRPFFEEAGRARRR